MKRVAIALLLVVLPPTALLAWGEKGHFLVNEVATAGVPNAMPHFFHEAYPRLVYLANDPDRIKHDRDALENFEYSNHFLDYEYVAALTLPPLRYRYIDAMHAARVPQQFGIDLEDPGFLPWRIAELTDEMTLQWKMWRRASDATSRKQIQENIIRLSGILGHYVGDASNPHHTTRNHNGWAEENRKGYPFDCETHSRFESWFVARTMDVPAVLPHARKDVVLRTDYFQTAMELILESNSMVEDLYVLDRSKGFAGRGSEESREFTAKRLARGAEVLRDLWWSAYVNSAEKPAAEKR